MTKHEYGTHYGVDWESIKIHNAIISLAEQLTEILQCKFYWPLQSKFYQISC